MSRFSVTKGFCYVQKTFFLLFRISLGPFWWSDDLFSTSGARIWPKQSYYQVWKESVKKCDFYQVCMLNHVNYHVNFQCAYIWEEACVHLQVHGPKRTMIWEQEIVYHDLDLGVNLDLDYEKVAKLSAVLKLKGESCWPWTMLTILFLFFKHPLT